MTQSHYIGRFAPSPTGPLHFGSLVAATASYLDARTNQGQWLVRMEDLDKPREVPGAADHILRTLDAFGFEWDGEILYQSQRDDIYQAYADRLLEQGLLYPCGCTRKEIESIAHAGIEGHVYPGTCRDKLPSGKDARAWRIRVSNERIHFDDAIQGLIEHDLQAQVGDFVLKRADGLFAYQLAVVVDDAQQGITHIVRGADLLNSTTRQIYLQQQLGLPTPSYAHNPLATNAKGEKLSKQTQARAIEVKQAGDTLTKAMRFLGLTPPSELCKESLSTIWQWAVQNWQLKQVPKQPFNVHQ